MHYFCAKHKVIDIIGGGGAALLVEVSQLQLTQPSGRSARNFAAQVFRPEV
jgi:hypothetical protein